MAARKSRSIKKESTFADRRTMNPPRGKRRNTGPGSAKAAQEHDTSNRLGGYEGKGNHARTGNRGHQ